ncbi:hypothetical protein LCGC14_1948460, partial [marine sediment metagenome]
VIVANTVVDLTQRAIREDMAILQRIFEVDFVPLIRQKEQLERREFNKSYAEVQELERTI